VKARRLVCHDVARIEVEDYELPLVGDDDILVENSCTAISTGTETYCWLHGGDMGHQPEFPRYTGYCSTGIVVDKGTNVDRVRIGDRVAAQGYHASHQVMHRHYHRVPDGVDSEDAVFLVMAAIAMRGIRRSQIQLGESMAVLGLGIVGQLALSLGRLAGAVPILGIDIDPGRLERARARGADFVLDANDAENVAERVGQLCVDDGANVVMEATGKPAVYPLAVRLACTAGRVVALGSPRGEVVMDFMRDVHLREVDIIGAFQPLTPERDHVYYRWSKDRDRRLLLTLMACGRLHIRDMITHRFLPDQCQDAYTMLVERPQEGLGVIFKWNN